MSKPRKIKAIIFDLDGTLLDTESLSDKAILQAFGDSLPEKVKEERRQDGNRLPWEIKKQIVGLRGGDWIPMVIAYAQKHWGVAKHGEPSDLPPPPSVEEMWRLWEENLNSFCPEVKACTGSVELVELLQANTKLPLGIATSSRKAAVAAKRLKHEKIFKHMKEIVTGDDPAVRNGKPAPDMYIEAARRLGVEPSECLIFEDALSGVKSGKAAGCVVVAVPDPRMDKDIFTDDADIILDDLWHFDGSQWGLNVNLRN